MPDDDVRIYGDPLGAANLDVLDRLDFEALNGGDWELFAALHTDDVVVHWRGTRTDGLPAHMHDVKKAMEAMPDARVTGHPIAIATGDWACVVAELPTGARAVVLARLVDGRIAEEHLFDG